MPEPYPWYAAVQGEGLEQGDLLRSCPVYRPTAEGALRHENADVIVLSHSCDLGHDKLEMVQVCPYWPLEMLAGRVPFLQNKRGKEELRRGNLPGYHLLNRCDLPGLEGDFLVVDFRALFGVHLDTSRGLARQQSPRLRLLPPYREHLAQAFARFFMRVGLPVDVPPFR
jgi:hypothetical protein